MVLNADEYIVLVVQLYSVDGLGNPTCYVWHYYMTVKNIFFASS